MKFISPPPDFNPIPAKRIKFRNMLTPGGVIGDEEVGKITAAREKQKDDLGELLDLSEPVHQTDVNVEDIPSRSIPLISEELSHELLELAESMSMNKPTESHLLDLSENPPPSTSRSLRLNESSSASRQHTVTTTSSFITVPSLSAIPTPSDESSTSLQKPLAPQTAAWVRSPASSSPVPVDSLIVLDDDPTTGAVDDITHLGASFRMSELADLDFVTVEPSDGWDSNSTERTLFDDRNQDEVVFQGRKSRRTSQVTVQVNKAPIDAVVAEKAFGKFSLGIKM